MSKEMTQNTVPLPEPELLGGSYAPHSRYSGWANGYAAHQMHAHAAKVCAEKDAEIERLTSERNIYKAADEAMQSQYGEMHEKCDDQAQEIERLRDCANMLYRHCVSLMETGKDRIINAGGQCDSVEVMEQSGPWLIEARATLKETK